MLKIRHDQMQSFGKRLRSRFVESELARIRSERPEQVDQVPDAAIHQFIDNAIERAAALQLVAVGDVQRFVDLTFRLGRQFEDDPAHRQVRTLLEAFEVLGQLRLDRVDKLLGADPAR
ncbi:MAG: hypothetical protein ABI564_10440 [Ideonella sp.]